MGEPSKAVFLSYASQDAAAAKRICDALRAGGVEVWFDQSELRGGDSWDQKIRKQIRECALFVPIISANTQARREGYFRLEWKLAEDRTHLMAKGTPFLVPVCVDDTKDWDAIVPDSFMNVQWTRLPGGATTETFVDRIGQLLAGNTTPPIQPVRARPVEAGKPDAEPIQTSRRPAWFTALIVIAPLLVGLALAWRVLPHGGNPPATKKAATTAAPAPDAWPRNPELRRAMELVDGFEANIEDFALAAELANKALAKNPTDPEAVTVMARVQVAFLFRGFDRSDERRATARRYAEHAVQLAPDDAEALAALGVFFIQRSIDLDRARELLNRAIALKPTEPFFWRHRDNALFVDPKVPLADALASAEKTAAQFPHDALAHYELARHYRDVGRIADMERELDRTIAISPIANAVVWKSRIALWVRADPEEMKALIGRVPSRTRSLERVVFSRWIYAMISGQAGDGLLALDSLTSNWIEDFDYVGPKGLLAAQLLELQHKPELARLQYEAALAEVRTRLARTPGDSNLRVAEIWILHGLGRDEEGRPLNRVLLETVRRPYRYAKLSDWWFTSIPGSLMIGDRATALQLIRESLGATGPVPTRRAGEGEVGEGATPDPAAEARTALRLRFKFDPRMASFRDDPEIVALLAEPKAETSAALSPARELAAKALTLVRALEATREDFALAEDLCQRALKLDSTDGDVWAIYSELNSAFGYRGWDTSPQRREQTRVTAERAIRLAPTSAEAKVAQAGAWTSFGINRAETEKLLREVLQERPNDQATLKFLAVTVLNRGGLDECLALNERSAALPGGDPLALFNNARYLWQRDRAAEAYATIQRSIAQQPFSSALVLKTMMELNWRGDLAAAEATLKQIPQSALLEDRANFVAGLVGYYQRRPDVALAAWSTFPRDYYADFVFDGPKGLLIGLADALDHRDAAAKIEWRTALQAVEKRIAATPNNPAPYQYKAHLLACLGERAAAEETLHTYEQLAGIKFTAGSPLSFTATVLYTQLGQLDVVFAHPSTAEVARLRFDPRLDALRADPRFEAFIERIRRQSTTPKP